MIDYELLARQRDTLHAIESRLRDEQGWTDEEADACAGMANLASWMIDWKDENRENREIAAMIRGGVAECDGTYPTVIRKSWAGFPILVLTEQERRVIVRALEMSELMFDVLREHFADDDDERAELNKSTIAELREKVGPES